jgi:hypothetical protein
MACAVKFKCKDWKFYWFLTPHNTGSYLKVFAVRFDDKKEAQAFVDRNRDRNPDAFFRIQPL